MCEQVRDKTGAPEQASCAEALRAAVEKLKKELCAIADAIENVVAVGAEFMAETISEVIDEAACMLQTLRMQAMREELRAARREQFRQKTRRFRLPFLRRRTTHRIRNDCARESPGH